jgi:hypothetical protein
MHELRVIKEFFLCVIFLVVLFLNVARALWILHDLYKNCQILVQSDEWTLVTDCSLSLSIRYLTVQSLGKDFM